jgi:hypothetical protein
VFIAHYWQSAAVMMISWCGPELSSRRWIIGCDDTSYPLTVLENRQQNVGFAGQVIAVARYPAASEGADTT